MKRKIYILVFACLLVSCGSKKGIVTKKKKDKTTKEVIVKKTPEVIKNQPKTTPEVKPRPKSSVTVYIDTYAEIAKSQMRTSKIPASITLAQGILESGSGNGRLAVKANNHFGIKCHGWKGAKIYHDDDELQECFRKYKKAEYSYRDHSEFLTGRKRYANLFKLKEDDYKGWARGLKKAGYATDPKYPNKLISLIERYELYKYDEEVLGKRSERLSSSTQEKESVATHVIQKGDTLYSLARRYKTTVENIKRLNGLTSNNLAIGQEIQIPN